MNCKAHLLAALAVIFGIAGLPLRAQDRAELNGTVTDPAGAVVAGAKVELSSTATGFHRATTTNTDGIYLFSSLPVGAYAVSISKDGFKPHQILERTKRPIIMVVVLRKT